MCTVSIVAHNNKTVFTFNRDERPERHAKVFLEEKQLNGKTIYYAKDAQAGGSWFTADNQGNVAMLFNGAFEKHIKLPKYTISRGRILLEIISANDLLFCFRQNDLNNVEPFSIIINSQGSIHRCTWDGNRKYIENIDKSLPIIFSSATLYDREIITARQNWLSGFICHQSTMCEDKMLEFHTTSNIDDFINGLKIDRPSGCKTLCVSQAVLEDNTLIMRHFDLIENNHHQLKIVTEDENKALVA